MMTTVKDVLIYEALENNKIYREEKKKKKISDKVKVKIDKSRERSKQSPKSKVQVWVKKKPKGILVSWRKKKTKTRSQLVKELDAIFSRYIRMRDADKNGICSCITCGDKKPRKEMQACHFISRWVYRYRRSEMNVRAWCYKCNVLLKWNYIPYTLFMIKKYWEDKVREMQKDKELVKVTTPDITYWIITYSLQVEELMKEKNL